MKSFRGHLGPAKTNVTIKDNLEPFETIPGHLGIFRTNADHLDYLGLFKTIWDYFEIWYYVRSCWTIVNHFRPFGDIMEQCGVF